MAEQGAVADTGTEAPGAGAAPGMDLSPVLERFDQLAQRMDGFDSQLQQFAPQPEAEEPEAGFTIDDLLGQEEQLDPQAVQQWLQGLAEHSEQSTQKAIQDALAPVLKQVEDMQVDRDAESLIESFPQLSDPEVAEATVTQAVQLAQRIGADPAVARRPGFIELVIMAERGRQAASGEVPVDGMRHPSLEAGAGAAPSSRGEGPSIAEQILSAGKPKSSFWGV